MNTFNPQLETDSIISFLKSTLDKTGKKRVVLNWSGGIDSTVCLYLLAKAIPMEQITILHLPYETSYADEFLPIFQYLGIAQSQLKVLSIKPMVDVIQQTLKINDSFRLGNVMARTRMIVAFDYAKKLNALVCGTENKTEELLGYFTRFGDEASDIEPIRNLYKTQVYLLAEHLHVHSNILSAKPTAGLWEGQTDEGEFGFSYAEADDVLFRYFDKSKTVEEIEQEGFLNARKVISFVQKNSFKHEVPYKAQ